MRFVEVARIIVTLSVCRTCRTSIKKIYISSIEWLARFNAGSNVVCIQQKRKRTNREQSSSAINEKKWVKCNAELFELFETCGGAPSDI
jgi:hypothetical protein